MTRNSKIIKKTVTIVIWFGGLLSGLLLLAVLLLQFSAVQTRLTGMITRQLSESLETTIRVERVGISFFNRIRLGQVLIEDRQGDTLLYVNRLDAFVERFHIRDKRIELSSVVLSGTKSYLSLDKNHFPNYKFLLDAL
ncbi:MAG: hypothetical protein AB7D05_09880, partial [Mangrovibacterium sp.]